MQSVGCRLGTGLGFESCVHDFRLWVSGLRLWLGSRGTCRPVQTFRATESRFQSETPAFLNEFRGGEGPCKSLDISLMA